MNFFGSFRGTAKKSALHDVFNKCCVRKCTKILFIIFYFFKFMSHQTAVPFRRTFQVPFDLKHKVNYYN